MRKKYKIDFFTEQDDYDIPLSQKAYMQRAFAEALKIFAINDRASVSVTFVDEDTIKQCNNENRGVDKVTDVLSFPLQSFVEGKLPADEITDGEYDEEGFFMLGDVVICSSVAERQAEEYGHSVERETVYLFVHSVLHLLGFDHEQEEEKKRMREKEEIIMKKIGLSRDE